MINGISICLMSDEEKQAEIKICQEEIRVEIRKLYEAYSTATIANPVNEPKLLHNAVRDLGYLERLISELEK